MSELPDPKSFYSLPLAVAAQWQNALIAAEREPFKPVLLEAQTVIAVHDAVERAVLAERERCAVLCKKQRLEDPPDNEGDVGYNAAVEQCVDALFALRLADCLLRLPPTGTLSRR